MDADQPKEAHEIDDARIKVPPSNRYDANVRKELNHELYEHIERREK